MPTVLSNIILYLNENFALTPYQNDWKGTVGNNFYNSVGFGLKHRN